MSWLMTNDMRVIVECSALSLSISIMLGCSVSESYFKTKASDGIPIEWRVLVSFFYLALRDGSWSSMYFLIVAASLTVICKVPLGKYSGLPWEEYGFWTGDTSWLQHQRTCTPATARTAFSSHGGICVYSIYSWVYRPCLGNVDDRYGTKTRQ